MDRTLESLIQRARAEHDCRPGATLDEIADAETRLGYSLTDDLRELLRACNGIQFWKTGEFPCRLLSSSEIKPVNLFLEGFLAGEVGPQGMVAIVEAEADCVGIGLDRKSSCYSRLVDCSHETFPHELFGVCNSIPEMLALILESKGDEWIWPAARVSGVDFAE